MCTRHRRRSRRHRGFSRPYSRQRARAICRTIHRRLMQPAHSTHTFQTRLHNHSIPRRTNLQHPPRPQADCAPPYTANTPLPLPASTLYVSYRLVTLRRSHGRAIYVIRIFSASMTRYTLMRMCVTRRTEPSEERMQAQCGGWRREASGVVVSD